ncbi:MAG: GGDEF domain-containing protein [Actinoplanes sp.]
MPVRRWWIHAGLPVAVAVCALVYVTVPAAQGMLYLAVGLLPIAAIHLGIRINRVTDRLPWRIASAGLAVMALPNLAWVVLVDVGQAAAVPTEMYAIGALGYAGIGVATALVVLRHAPADPGGVLQAALTGLGLSGPLWQFLLRPLTEAAGAGPQEQVVLLTVAVVLMTVTGSLIRLISTTVRARPALSYLFLSVVATTAANVAVTATSAGGTRTPLTHLAETGAFIGYLALGAAALHPSVRYLSTAEGTDPDELSAGRLLSTGAMLLMIPLTSALSMISGSGSTDALLIIGTVVAVPLVLLRFWHLGTQRLGAERALAHQATHDDLTGLPNRRAVQDRVAEAVAALAQGRTDSVAVLFCDLNGFKPINDRYGHQSGDHVLRVIADRLRHGLRDADLVGRFGGDEFVVVCQDIGNGSVAGMVSRIERACAEPIHLGDATCTVGTSVGAAVARRGSPVSADDLIAEADHQMYRHKQMRGATVR